VISNLDKVIRSLGGASSVAKLVDEDNKDQARCTLQPDDHFAKYITSGKLATDNLLLRITVPKRTGRKRKRGSGGPFIDHGHQGRAASSRTISSHKDLLQTYQDCHERSKVEVVGHIEQTHRFRDPPDVVYTTSSSPFVTHFKNTFGSMNYHDLKNFKIDPHADPTDLMPPPEFCAIPTPANYSYRQNQAMKTIITGDGVKRTFNSSARLIVRHLNIRFDEEAPVGPPRGARQLEQHDKTFQDLVAKLRTAFDERPMWTRRSIRNLARERGWHPNLDHLELAYLAYQFSSGPWRDALIRFGVDPRTDAKYRVYQTMAFQIEPRDGKKVSLTGRGGRGGDRSRSVVEKDDGGLGNQSHVFDGHSVGMDGRTWQVCDITEPAVKYILQTEDFRTECDIQRDGWYQIGTWAKARTILRAEIAYLVRHAAPMPDEEIQNLLAIPDRLDEDNHDVAPPKRGTLGLSKAEMQIISGARIRINEKLSEERRGRDSTEARLNSIDLLSREGTFMEELRGRVGGDEALDYESGEDADEDGQQKGKRGNDVFGHGEDDPDGDEETE